MIWEILILVLAIPIGFLIAHLTREELVDGKKYFRVLVIVSIILGIWFWLTGFMWMSWTMGFVGVVSLVSFVKASDKKWVRK